MRYAHEFLGSALLAFIQYVEYVTELGGKCSCVVDDLINDSVYQRIT